MGPLCPGHSYSSRLGTFIHLPLSLQLCRGCSYSSPSFKHLSAFLDSHVTRHNPHTRHVIGLWLVRNRSPVLCIPRSPCRGACHSPIEWVAT
eukprot:6168087-Pleurochrysis_carterae.AAC.1